MEINDQYGGESEGLGPALRPARRRHHASSVNQEERKARKVELLANDVRQAAAWNARVSQS